MSYFKNKKVLVTGGTGLIGLPLVKKLVEMDARVRVASLDEQIALGNEIEFIKGDLCDKHFCDHAMKDIRVVFHLAGIKGGIGVARSRAATFLTKNILMNTHIMEAARKASVRRFLYASSICVYPPARVFLEKNALTGLPHPSDRFGGIAKLVGEMQVEAYRLQYGLKNFFIARPTNTYGPHDNFNIESALVIPALIFRIFKGENPLKIWGDGSAVRDFIFSEDVADFLILMVEKNTTGPFNVSSGKAVTIKTLAETIVRHAEKFIGRKIGIRWDPGKPGGEKYRIASINKARSQLGWTPRTTLDEGILRTIEWYHSNRSDLPKRYTILSEK